MFRGVWPWRRIGHLRGFAWDCGILALKSPSRPLVAEELTASADLASKGGGALGAGGGG